MKSLSNEIEIIQNGITYAVSGLLILFIKQICQKVNSVHFLNILAQFQKSKQGEFFIHKKSRWPLVPLIVGAR